MPPVEKLKKPLRMKLSEWIPHAGVAAAFEAKGVTKLYPWPASGKSLVAEVLMIRRLLAAIERQARSQPRVAGRQVARPPSPRALLVLPYVSIVSEKTEHLTRVLAPMRARVRGYTGADQTGTPLSAPDEVVAVVTMEKANSTVNRLLAEGRLAELVCVVVDEAHMVGDPHRGICLELCLTKLRYGAAAAAAARSSQAPGKSTSPPALGPLASRSDAVKQLVPADFSCQLVCMSATMSGLDDMCGWLGARLFMTNFRPVPLTEHAVFKGKVFRKLTQKELEERAAEDAKGQGSHPGTAGRASLVGKGAGGAAGATDGPVRAGAGAANAGFVSAASVAAPGGDAASTIAIEPLAEERELPESSSKDPDRLVVLVAEVARLLADLLPKLLGPVSAEMVQARKALMAKLQDASGGYLSQELERLVMAGVAYHHAGLTSQERAAVERGFRAGLIHTLTATSTLAAGINLPARRVILRSTLLYQQAGYGQISAATHQALTALRKRKLVTYSPPPQQPAPSAAQQPLGGKRPRPTSGGSAAPAAGAGGGAGAVWQPTQMGRAIYESCLPTAAGEELYGRLTSALNGLALEGGLHMLCLLLTEPLPVELDDWGAWAAMLERMPREPHLRVAGALGVSLTYAQRLAGGRRGNGEESGRHCRFASACLLHAVLCEGDLHELEAVWGQPGGLTKQGISRGQLQKLQGDLSKWAGMAAVMAGSCGWWALQALLDGLSQQAAAGTRPELLPLMVLPGITGAQARGLYAAGFTKPALLAAADEEDVKKALASSLPRALRQQKPGKGCKESAVAAAAVASSGNAVVARWARGLIGSARQYMTDMAGRLAAEEAEIEEAERRATGAGRFNDAADEAIRAAAQRAALEAAERLSCQLQAVRVSNNGTALPGRAVPGNTGFLRGSARITELSDASSAQAREAFLQAWRSQPTFAVAVVSSRPLALEPELQHLQQQQLGTGASSSGGSTAAAAASLQAGTAEESLGGGGDPQSMRRANSGHSGDSSLVEGLVITWSLTEAVVLLFRHGAPGAAGVADGDGSLDIGDGCDDITAGVKRKTAAQEGGKRKAAAQARGDCSCSALWRAACEVLAVPGSSKVCWQAEAALAALVAAGCDPEGQWDDPRVMAWMAQGTAGPQDFSLQELQRAVLPSYAIRVPLQHRGAVTAACRGALVAWALAAPLRAMLAAEGAATHYGLVEAPLTRALARTRLHFEVCAARQASPQRHASAAAGERPRHGNSGGGGVALDEAACRQELARMAARRDTCRQLLSSILCAPLDTSNSAAVEALCARESLVRRTAPPPPELRTLCPQGQPPPRCAAFCTWHGVHPSARPRAEALAALLTWQAAAAEMAAALEALLLAAGSEASRQAPLGGGLGGEEPGPQPDCSGQPARFALHRSGMEGRLAVVYGNGVSGGAADGTVLMRELCSAPLPAPSLQHQYCASADGERYLKARLPLPVLFLDALPAEGGQQPPADPRLLRHGLLLELQGPDPRVALQFETDGHGDRPAASPPGRCHVAVVAALDPLTRQPLHLALPATSVWCAASCCGPEQAAAATLAGQLLGMAAPQALRCPAEEFLVPPPGCAFVHVLYPYLPLAVVAHCSGDERLVEALYQPQPWAAVASVWEASQAEHLRRLLAQSQITAASGSLCAPPPLELAAWQVVSLALLGGGSHKDLAAALGLGGGAGGKTAAAALVSSFLEAFPGVSQHREQLAAAAKREGYVSTPSGHRLRPTARQLGNAGVAAAVKLQRLLGRLQCAATAAEVVRTAAALAIQRADQCLADADRIMPNQPSPAAAQVQAAVGLDTAGQPAAAPRRRASLVWCGEAGVSLCVPAEQLGVLLEGVREAASAGVMGHLGLRVPLHGNGLLANEALWAAFLESAGRLELRQPPPAAAVLAAVHVDLRQLAGGPLKPSLQPLDEMAYPGYAQQHILPPGPGDEPPPAPPRRRQGATGGPPASEQQSATDNTQPVNGSYCTGPRQCQRPHGEQLPEAQHGDQRGWQRQAAADSGYTVERVSRRLVRELFPDLPSCGDGRGDGDGDAAGSAGRGGQEARAGPGGGGESAGGWRSEAAAAPGGSGGHGAAGAVASAYHATLARAEAEVHRMLLAELRRGAAAAAADGAPATEGQGAFRPIELLTPAELQLLATALADPLNARMVLLSETSVPVRPAAAVWSQLMWEERSRVDACRDVNMDPARWPPHMATPHLLQSHWRKSSQWFALTRPHAALAVADRHVSEQFARFCFTRHRSLATAAGGFLPPPGKQQLQQPQRGGRAVGGGGNGPSRGQPHAGAEAEAGVGPVHRTMATRQQGDSKADTGKGDGGPRGQRMRKVAAARAASDGSGPRPEPPLAESSDPWVLHRALTASVHPCVSDEHYLPTLLASYGLDQQGGWRLWGPDAGCSGAAGAASAASVGRVFAWAAPAPAAPALGAVLPERASDHAVEDGRPHRRSAGSPTDSSQPGVSADRTAGSAAGDDGAETRKSAPQGPALAAEQAASPHASWYSDDGSSATHETGDDASVAAAGDAAAGGPRAAAASLRTWLEQLGYVSLGYRCHLFARKFPALASRTTFEFAMGCPPKGLGLGPWLYAQDENGDFELVSEKAPVGASPRHTELSNLGSDQLRGTPAAAIPLLRGSELFGALLLTRPASHGPGGRAPGPTARGLESHDADLRQLGLALSVGLAPELPALRRLAGCLGRLGRSGGLGEAMAELQEALGGHVSGRFLLGCTVRAALVAEEQATAAFLLEPARRLSLCPTGTSSAPASGRGRRGRAPDMPTVSGRGESRAGSRKELATCSGANPGTSSGTAPADGHGQGSSAGGAGAPWRLGFLQASEGSLGVSGDAASRECAAGLGTQAAPPWAAASAWVDSVPSGYTAGEATAGGGTPVTMARPFQLTYTLLLRLQMQRPAPVGIAVPDCVRAVQDVNQPSRDLCLLMDCPAAPPTPPVESTHPMLPVEGRGRSGGAGPSGSPSGAVDGSVGTGGAGGVQSLVLVGSRAGGGVLLAFYVCFPHRLPAPLVEAVRDSCQRLLQQVLIRPLVPKLASSGDLAAELAALRRGTPGAFAFLRLPTETPKPSAANAAAGAARTPAPAAAPAASAAAASPLLPLRTSRAPLPAALSIQPLHELLLRRSAVATAAADGGSTTAAELGILAEGSEEQPSSGAGADTAPEPLTAAGRAAALLFHRSSSCELRAPSPWAGAAPAGQVGRWQSYASAVRPSTSGAMRGGAAPAAGAATAAAALRAPLTTSGPCFGQQSSGAVSSSTAASALGTGAGASGPGGAGAARRRLRQPCPTSVLLVSGPLPSAASCSLAPLVSSVRESICAAAAAASSAAAATQQHSGPAAAQAAFVDVLSALTGPESGPLGSTVLEMGRGTSTASLHDLEHVSISLAATAAAAGGANGAVTSAVLSYATAAAPMGCSSPCAFLMADPEAADLADLRLPGRIGQGGGAAVYLGRMGCGLEVAVKLLELPESVEVGELVDEITVGASRGLLALAAAGGSGAGGSRGSAGGAFVETASDGGLGVMLAAEVARQHLRARRSLLASATELAMLTSVSHPHIVQVYGVYSNVILEPEPPVVPGPRGFRLRQRDWAMLERPEASGRGGGREDTLPDSEASGPVYTAVCMTLCELGSLASALASGDFPNRKPQAARPFSAPAHAAGEGEGVGALGGRQPRREPPLDPDTPAFGSGVLRNMKSVYLTLLEVALALRYLHGRHIVHRDLKPGNVLLKGRSATSSDPRGFTAKLADFGCALVMDAPGTAAAAAPAGAGGQRPAGPGAEAGPGSPPASGSGRCAVQDTACGTLDHMAPEVVSGRGARITAAVDVYAFGVLMLETITGGRRPFGSVPPERIGRLVAAGARPLFPTWVPEPYRALAEACWAHDPSQRPSAAQLVVAIRLQLQQQETRQPSDAAA
ncbi:hypothetical protein GPECTOR_20g396 [Gonium pectorale]|uniref:DNA-directed DNA polymerase n=1 Tax=Gonium pectorale TaxID=33097 RepID=A0A150GI90_GONPE|nr:hypothetical protein GPECTOR_20g396 [Gonium pectorale]|eukprot:KXZ49542.1 hypothetical protein GPECTOR_20g396 [Gonium pectorale]